MTEEEYIKVCDLRSMRSVVDAAGHACLQPEAVEILKIAYRCIDRLEKETNGMVIATSDDDVFSPSPNKSVPER